VVDWGVVCLLAATVGPCLTAVREVLGLNRAVDSVVFIAQPL